MKIVHVVWKMVVGGTENMLVDITREQADAHEVHIVAINRGNDSKLLDKLDPRVKFYSCERALKSRSPLFVLKLNAYLYRLHPDVIHTHFSNLYRYIFIPETLKVRTVHNSRNDTGECRRYDRCFAISRSVAEEWKAAGCEIQTITNGINISQIKCRDMTTPLKEGSVLHFVQVSRLNVEQKGQDLLIDALAILRDELVARKSGKSFVMHFVGGGPDEALLRELVVSRNLSQYVIFEGEKGRDWIYENLYKFDLFVQPSRFEGFGLTVAEACAAGIPVLVCDIEGPMEVIDNGRLGMKFSTGDYHDLAARLLDFTINGYPDGILPEARDFVKARFDVKRTATEYLNAYRELLQLRKV